MDTSYSEHFRREIETFLTRSRMKRSIFGLEAAGDPSFVTTLQRGRSVTLAKADRILKFIRAYENK